MRPQSSCWGMKKKEHYDDMAYRSILFCPHPNNFKKFWPKTNPLFSPSQQLRKTVVTGVIIVAISVYLFCLFRFDPYDLWVAYSIDQWSQLSLARQLGAQVARSLALQKLKHWTLHTHFLFNLLSVDFISGSTEKKPTDWWQNCECSEHHSPHSVICG